MSINPSDLAALSGMYENAGALQKQEIEQRYKLGKAQIAANMKIAQMESKDKRYGIEAVREVGLKNIEQARLEMERIGIPEMEIKRFVAEKTYEVALAELALKREVDVAGLTGMYEGNPTMAAREMENQLGLDQGALTGVYHQTYRGGSGDIGGYGYNDANSFRMAQDLARKAGTYTGERTLAGQAHDLEVAKFGAQLASTPDTYFQARRFQGMDAPRLLGGAGAQTSGPTGGPTPGVATMGSYLSGADPYGTPYGGPSAGAAAPAAPGTLGTPGTPEDDRAKQVAKLASVSPPSPYDGLDDQDTATLKLMESIYQKGGQAIAGGEYERLKASGKVGFLNSAGRLLGYDPAELESSYNAYRPAQGAANLAG